MPNPNPNPNPKPNRNRNPNSIPNLNSNPNRNPNPNPNPNPSYAGPSLWRPFAMAGRYQGDTYCTYLSKNTIGLHVRTYLSSSLDKINHGIHGHCALLIWCHDMNLTHCSRRTWVREKYASRWFLRRKCRHRHRDQRHGERMNWRHLATDIGTTALDLICNTISRPRVAGKCSLQENVTFTLKLQLSLSSFRGR